MRMSPSSIVSPPLPLWCKMWRLLLSLLTISEYVNYDSDVKPRVSPHASFFPARATGRTATIDTSTSRVRRERPAPRPHKVRHQGRRPSCGSWWLWGDMEMYLFNESGTGHSSFSMLFLPTLFKIVISQVAVKSLLVYTSDQLSKAEKNTQVSILDRTLQVSFMPDITVSQRIKRELQICARLKHTNILPVYGYTFGFGPVMAIVSPWAENGNLTAYIGRENPATLTVVRRFQIVCSFQPL
jgi:serine/threonine protein kinase